MDRAGSAVGSEVVAGNCRQRLAGVQDAHVVVGGVSCRHLARFETA